MQQTCCRWASAAGSGACLVDLRWLGPKAVMAAKSRDRRPGANDWQGGCGCIDAWPGHRQEQRHRFWGTSSCVQATQQCWRCGASVWPPGLSKASSQLRARTPGRHRRNSRWASGNSNPQGLTGMCFLQLLRPGLCGIPAGESIQSLPMRLHAGFVFSCVSCRFLESIKGGSNSLAANRADRCEPGLHVAWESAVNSGY